MMRRLFPLTSGLLGMALLALSLLPLQAGAQQVPRNRTLVIAQNFDPQTLWPNGTTASTNLNPGAAIVEPLFWINPATNKMEPVLATSYTLQSPTVHRVELRRGVRFSNGEPANADALIHTLKVFTDKVVTPAYTLYSAPIDKFEKVDEYTVTIHTKDPYPAMALALTQVYLIPPGAWNQAGAAKFGQAPIGTGPFKFTEWVKDDRVVMDRNTSYWGTAPKGIERVIWKPVPDDTARAVGLEAGEYDVAASLSGAAIPRLQGQRNLQLYSVSSYRLFTMILSMLPKHQSPLLDKRVRLAINHAIDNNAIVKNLFFGRAEVLQGQVLRKEQLGFDPDIKPYPFDLVKAKALMTEAGYPNGFDIDFKIPSGRYAQDREVCEAIAGMLAKIGIRTKIIALEGGEFLRQLRTQELGPMSFVGLAPPDDPHFQVSQYRSDWRYTFIQSAELDKLIDDGVKETDTAKRAAIYKRAMRLLNAEAPLVPMYLGLDIYGSSNRVKGLRPTGEQRLFLYGVSLE
jgi:peptide/nickel transport system substrate-binding protein